MAFLFSSGGLRLYPLFHIQGLPHLEPHQRLGPDLVNLPVQLGKDVLRGGNSSHIHRPEPPAASLIPEIIVGVAGTKEDTPPGIGERSPSVGGPEDVLALGKELLGLVVLRLGQGCELSHLYDPHSLDQLPRLFTDKGGEAVREPLPPQFSQQRAFPNALGPGEDGHCVVFAAGGHGPGHRRCQGLPSCRPGVGGICRPQVIHKEGVQPGNPVPGEPGQILPHRVKGVVVPADAKSIHGLFLARDAVGLFQVPAQAAVVVVAPGPFRLSGVPGERPAGQPPASKGIGGDAPPQDRVVFQDKEDVVRGLCNIPGGLHFQLSHPAGRVLLPGGLHRPLPLKGGEVPHCLLVALLAHKGGHAGILHCQLTHSGIAGQAVGGAPRLGTVVQLPKTVEAHQVKGVHQSAGAGVGGVVAIQEFAAVVDHRPAGGGAPQVGVPVRHAVHRLVHAGEQLLHGPVDIVDAAEGPHHSLLALWVPLLGGQLGDTHRPWHLGPLGAVPPVLVLGQEAVGGEEGLILPGVDIGAAGAAGGPIHEAGCLKGGGVHPLQADVLGHPPGQGLVLVCRGGAVQGQQHPEPGGLRAVLAGGIDAVAAPQAIHPAEHLLGAPGGDAVQVQGEDVPPGDGPRLAPGPGEGPRHKAAHVFEVVLLGLFHTQILRHGLGAPDRGLEPRPQLRKEQGLGRPACGPPAAPGGDGDCTVICHKPASILSKKLPHPAIGAQGQVRGPGDRLPQDVHHRPEHDGLVRPGDCIDNHLVVDVEHHR